MPKSLKGAGSFVVAVVLVYLAVKYWSQIKAALMPGPASNPTGNLVPVSASTPSSALGDLFVSPGAQFQGGISGMSGGGLWGSGVLGSNVGPGQADESASASPFVFVNTSQNFAAGCSTHLWDRKPLCA